MRPSDFVPPVLWRQLLRRRQAGKVFASYESAAVACGGGYGQEMVARVVCEKTRAYRDTIASQSRLGAEFGSYRVLALLLLGSGGSRLNVLDFGGACGAHYFFARELLKRLSKRVSLAWHVVETPTMVASGRSLADGSLAFFDQLETAVEVLHGVDLVFTSGTLQYHASPYDLITSLTRVQAENLFITRTALSASESEMISIQKTYLASHGPGSMPEGFHNARISLPVTFCPKAKIEQIIEERYSIRLEIEEERNAYYAGSTGVNMYGYWATLRPSSAGR